MNDTMPRRRFLRALAIATGGTVLAACAPKVVTKEVEKVITKEVEKVVKETVVVEGTPQVIEKVVTAAAAPKAAVTLNFVTLHPSLLAYAEKWNDPAFEKEFPNITVKRELTAGSEYFAKVLMMHAAGTPFDVMHLYDDMGSELEWAVKGVYKNLDPMIERDHYDMAQFYPQVLDHCRRPYGQYLQFPVCMDPGNIALYYNKELLKQAGVPEPTPDWTFTGEFEQALRDINKAFNSGGKTQIASWVGYSGQIKTVQPLVYSWGGSLFDKEGLKCLIGEEKAKSALQWYSGLLDEGVVPRPDFYTEGDYKLFMGQKAVFISYWMSLAPAMFPAAKEQGWDIGATVGPKGPAGTHGSWVPYHTLGIHSDSKYPDESWEYIKFWASPEMADTYWANSTCLSARISEWQDPKLIGKYDFWKQVATVLPTALSQTFPANLRGRECLSVSGAIMQPMWLGQTKFEEGMDQLVQELQAVLDQPMIK